jgi:outer membrane receptor protein involved in Fe transport
MKSFRVLIAAVVFAFAVSAAQLMAQAAQTTTPMPAVQTPAPAQTPAKPPQTPPPTPPKELSYEDTVVVSASKTEQKIVDAPVTMTVFTPIMLEKTPAANYGDLLRGVPGVNVTQLSARDINITSRAATGSLSTSQLAVLDGRSLYQDFFGFIMWDFMPANMDEIKQIEVIRGPASAVWGANALNGVVNIITKSPREMRGGSVTMGVGTFDKHVTDGDDAKAGNMFFVNGTVADAINSEWSYKLSAGYSSTDAFARPTGLIKNGGTTPYPAFTNEGTKQPKFSARLDRDFSDGQRLTFEGGTAGTSGIMETGIGPFRINSGTMMSFGKVGYTKKAFHVQAFMNALDGDAPNLLTVDSNGAPIQFKFDTKTFDLEAGDSRAVGQNVFTYGGNIRVNQFHLTLAPGETSRTEGGGYLQDELFLNDHVRIVAGARVDKFSSIDKAVFSPRVALVLKPAAARTFRLSYNRAFRAPSMINNNLDVTISNPLPLIALNPSLVANHLPELFTASDVFLVPTRATGNHDLTEEHIDAFEVSYTGKVGERTLVSAAYYVNKTKNSIFFTVKENYALTVPPAGFTSIPKWALLGPAGPLVATQVWGGVQASANFPKEYTYKNLGTETNQGLELGLETSVGARTTGFVNYSFQAEPKPEFPGLNDAQALAEVNLPAKHRFNVGVTSGVGRLFYSVNVSAVGKAFWQDVLDSRYSGGTKKYTTTNVLVGTTFNKATFQVRVNNLTNATIQQHIFGDLLKRSIVAELKINMPKMK